MANVSASSRDRGQMILVGAFALSMTFVAIALLLNSAVYTENLASRSSDETGGQDVVQFRQETRRGVGGIIEHVNQEGGPQGDSFVELYDNRYIPALDQWERLTGRHLSSNGRLVYIAPTGDSTEAGTEGTRIAQDTEGGFQAANGNSDWTLAREIPASRNLRLSVSDQPLRDGSSFTTASEYLSSQLFRIKIDEDTAGGTTEWYVFIYGDGGTSDSVYVRGVRVNPDGSTALSRECSYSAGNDDHVVVDITGAKVGERDCGPLRFFGDLSSGYTIRYRNSDVGTDSTIEGTYELVVKQLESNVDDSENGPYGDEPTSSSSPYAAEAIYSITVEISYTTPSLNYKAEIIVAPGKPDD